jgi:riboflavin kinase / FMN hydrolase
MLTVLLLVVQAAQAAGMHVLAIPSLIHEKHSSFQCRLLPSLLDVRPEVYGLPEFGDYIHSTVPLESPWRLQGPVVKGFGRGSRVAFSTACLSAC